MVFFERLILFSGARTMDHLLYIKQCGLELNEEIVSRLAIVVTCYLHLFQGTTGNPKGATLTHHNLVNNAYLVGQALAYDQVKGLALNYCLFFQTMLAYYFIRPFRQLI